MTILVTALERSPDGGWGALPLVLVAALLAGCSDHAILWRDPPYVVHWIDDPQAISLNYDIGEDSTIGRVGAKVVAVGANTDFVVAKQASGGYFYIDRHRDGMYLQAEAVTGPLSLDEFRLRKEALSLPDFTKAFEREALKSVDK